MSYDRLWQSWDPWSFIPADYNLGLDLTTAQVAHGRGDQVVLLWENAAGRARSLSYRQLDELSTCFARVLAHCGVSRGARVLLRLPNIPEFYVAALGAAKNGCIFVPTSTQFRTSELEYRLRDSEASAVVVTSSLLHAVEEVAPRCPALQHIFVVPYPDPGPVRPYADFVQACSDTTEQAAMWQPAATRHDDLAFLGYTSGTTGDSKGVAHYHRYPRAYEGQGRFWHDYRDGDVVACPSELGWLLPLATTFLYALCRGLTVVLYDSMGQPFAARRWFELFQRYRISNFTATPTAYRHLLAAAELGAEYDLSWWRHGVSCGEPLPAETFQGVQRHFRVTLFDGLGTTECPVYCSSLVPCPVRAGSCGRPGAATVIKLMDGDLRPVAEGAEGILCVRRVEHPGIMQGYWQKPEQTAEVFRGPWYVTGDVLRRDQDGYYWFQGRTDDLIKSAGYLISPFEIERCLDAHSAVAEAAVVGEDDLLRGQVIKAYIVLRNPEAASEQLADDIRAFVRGKLAPYKCPRRIEFAAAIPKTTSGKIRRVDLRTRPSLSDGTS